MLKRLITDYVIGLFLDKDTGELQFLLFIAKNAVLSLFLSLNFLWNYLIMLNLHQMENPLLQKLKNLLTLLVQLVEDQLTEMQILLIPLFAHPSTI
ncbi:hypothetical protein SDC9_193588 [bioreactor metagenome]|uniref:Uncharacterized protein n=1 Tax=bioreactor metagenome TaxID=1076179 RepID=A0A645I6I7_9ZZZZ